MVKYYDNQATRSVRSGYGRHRAVLAVAAVLLLTVAFTSSCSSRRALDKKIKGVMEIANQVPVTTESRPWEMFNGIYALGLRFIITDGVTQERMQAMGYLSSGVVAGLVGEDKEGAYFAAKTSGGEGERHRNEFMGIMIDAGADVDTNFVTDLGVVVSINTFLRRSMRKLDAEDLAKSPDVITGPDGNELGWTLTLMAHTDMLTSTWLNHNDKITTTEDILAVALSRPIDWGTFNGLIEQRGIAVAVREFKKNRLEEELAQYKAAMEKNKEIELTCPTESGVELDGVWRDAQKNVELVTAILKKNRNDEGAFSSAWALSRDNADPEETVLYTGLAMDFLVAALDDEQLREEWIEDTVIELASLIRDNKYQLYESSDALTTAVHALVRYRERVLAKKIKLKEPVEFESDEDKSSCCD